MAEEVTGDQSEIPHIFGKDEICAVLIQGLSPGGSDRKPFGHSDFDMIIRTVRKEALTVFEIFMADPLAVNIFCQYRKDRAKGYCDLTGIIGVILVYEIHLFKALP